MDWLLKPVIPKASWPKVSFKPKQAITEDEHRRIVAREKNEERRAFYELCWHLGASQMDIANLTAEDVDWHGQTICYEREKLKNQPDKQIKPPLIRFGEEVAGILRLLPKSGPLFPNLRKVQSKDRANEFRQRCHGLEIFGVTLHSYRYAWAERARKCGYAYHSVPVALYAWLRHFGDFPAALKAALDCGGDTDTIGAIVGALAGASCGERGIPAEWRTGIWEWPRSCAFLRQVAARLFEQKIARQPLGPVPYFWLGLVPRNVLFLMTVLAHGFARLLPRF